MQYVAIISHAPAQCPSTDSESHEAFASAVARMGQLAGEMGLSDLQFHALLPGHRGVVIVESPDYKTVCRYLVELRIDSFHDVDLYESVTAEEALVISTGRIGQSA